MEKKTITIKIIIITIAFAVWRFGFVCSVGGRFFHPRLQRCSGRSGRRFDRAAVVRVRGASVRGTVMAVGLAGPVQPQRHFLPSFGVAIILPSLYGFCWWVFSHFSSCHRCGSSSPVYITVPHSRRRASSPPHFPHRTLSSHTPVLRVPRKVGGCSPASSVPSPRRN